MNLCKLRKWMHLRFWVSRQAYLLLHGPVCSLCQQGIRGLGTHVLSHHPGTRLCAQGSQIVGDGAAQREQTREGSGPLRKGSQEGLPARGVSLLSWVLEI